MCYLQTYDTPADTTTSWVSETAYSEKISHFYGASNENIAFNPDTQSSGDTQHLQDRSVTYHWEKSFGPYSVTGFASNIVDKDATGCTQKTYPLYIGGEDDTFASVYFANAFLVKDSGPEDRFIHIGFGLATTFIQTEGSYFAMTNSEGNLLWIRKIASDDLGTFFPSYYAPGDTDANFLYFASEYGGKVQLVKVSVDNGSYVRYVDVIPHALGLLANWPHVPSQVVVRTDAAKHLLTEIYMTVETSNVGKMASASNPHSSFLFKYNQNLERIYQYALNANNALVFYNSVSTEFLGLLLTSGAGFSQHLTTTTSSVFAKLDPVTGLPLTQTVRFMAF